MRGPAVEAGVELDERLEVLAPRERREAVAVDADELGRHALADLGLVAAVGQDHQAAVAVEVDEARRDDLAGRVDRPADVGRCRRPGSRSRIRPSTTATVPGRPGAPVPSTMVPPAISRSACSVICARARSSARRPGQPAPAHPGRADHVGMRPEDQPRGEIGWVVVGRLAVERRHVRRVDGDEVGLLAGLERTDDLVEPERSRAVERPQPQPVERRESGLARRRRSTAAPSGRRRRRA